MNEFIVWDKRSKCFILDDKGFDRFEMYMDGTLHYYQNCHDGDGFGSEDYESFNYIGLKDINDNKIYADSSIVYFKEPYNGSELKGAFTWCNETFRYKIRIIQGTGRFQEGTVQEMMKESRWCGLVHKFVDYKIIDTIQENKLGLIKCN